MNILIDVGHPAHVHLFKNAAKEWISKGNKVVFVARDKDVTIRLLDHYGFKYQIASQARKGFAALIVEFLMRGMRVLSLARKNDCSLLLGTSVSIGIVSKLTGSHSIVFSEDDAEAVKWFARLAYPFADVIVTPASLTDDLGTKHVVYNSYQELAYLHPDRYQPDPGILTELGVTDDEKYFVLRFVALQAAHDKGESGLSPAMRSRIVRELSQYGKVFISTEGTIPEEFKEFQLRIPPERIHDVLSFATLLVSDSQTMTAEAAVLGLPSLRCSSFAGRLSVLEELEHKYGLTYAFRPDEEGQLFNKLIQLLQLPDLRSEWQRRRKLMLSVKIDLTQWILHFIEDYQMSVNNSAG